MGGIIFSKSVSTKSTPTNLNGGTGTLTVLASMSLSTTDQILTITADQFDFQSGSTVSSGTARSTLNTYSGNNIGVGTILEQVAIEGGEVQNIHAVGLVVGSTVSKNMKIVDINNVNSENIQGITTLLTTRDNAFIQFTGARSTFFGLAVQSDDGISIGTDLAGSSSILYLDSDYDDSIADDNSGTIFWSTGKTMDAKHVLTLEATSAVMSVSGELSLRAGTGIVLLNDLRNELNRRDHAGGTYVFDADYELFGDGTLTLVSGREVVSNHGTMMITAWDIDLSGSLSAGTKPMSLHGSKTDQTIVS